MTEFGLCSLTGENVRDVFLSKESSLLKDTDSTIKTNTLGLYTDKCPAGSALVL